MLQSTKPTYVWLDLGAYVRLIGRWEKPTNGRLYRCACDLSVQTDPLSRAPALPEPLIGGPLSPSRYCSASIARVTSRMSFCADGLALLALERLAAPKASTNIACRFAGSFSRLAAVNVLAA